MRALALLAGLWLAAPAPPTPPVPAPAADAPAIGKLLVANRQVAGFFAETVIVLVDHGGHGSLGLIVNRPVELSLEELLPEVEAARGHTEHAYLGGPVEPQKMMLLIRAKQMPTGAAAVLDGLHVSVSRETLVALLRGGEGVEFRAYVGYAGWAGGQLEGEIARGDWTLAPGDAETVFTNEAEGLWQRLLRRHQEIQVERFAPVARGAKSINLSAPWRSAAESSACPTSGRARSSTR